jgi:hypothetical protein
VPLQLIAEAQLPWRSLYRLLSKSKFSEICNRCRLQGWDLILEAFQVRAAFLNSLNS